MPAGGNRAPSTNQNTRSGSNMQNSGAKQIHNSVSPSMQVDHTGKPVLSSPLNKNHSGQKNKILRAVNNNSTSNVSTNDNSAPGVKI